MSKTLQKHYRFKLHRQAADRFMKGDIVIALNLLEHLAKVSAHFGSINFILIIILYLRIFYVVYCLMVAAL